MDRHPTFDQGEATSLLERTPRVLDAWLRNLPDAWVNATEGPETWSAFDVVGHLVHGERTDWMTRARTILQYGRTRTFEPFDRFAQLAAEEESLASRLTTFADLRRENLAELHAFALDETKLRLEGSHPEFGAVTLRQLLSTWVVHDLGHLAQVGRVLARRYRDDVGPWAAYLPVLGR